MSEDEHQEVHADGEMGFLEHIAELRTRLLWSALAIAILSIIGWSFSKETFDLLSQPFFAAFHDNILIGTGPAEAFLLRLKVAVLTGTLLSLPIIFQQCWLFISPGLHESERKFAFPFILITSGLFFLGVWFCYSVVLPYAFEFFYSQYEAVGAVTPTIRISEFLSLLTKVLLGFGIAFETPVLAFILGRLGVLTSSMLLAAGRYAIIFIFFISALLTPPDVLTQFLMAGPLLLLYGISIVIVHFTGRKREDGESQEDKTSDSPTNI